MTIDGIREAVHAVPFRPFGLRFADGKLVKVAHQDYIAFGPKGRTVVVYGLDDSFRVLDVMRVIALERKGRVAGRRC